MRVQCGNMLVGLRLLVCGDGTYAPLGSFMMTAADAGNRQSRIEPHGVTPGAALCVRLPCAPERYHANDECTPRSPRVQPFSALPGLARLSRRMQECETRFPPSSPTCAFPRGP